jgi:hypothetical protein
MDAGPQDPGSSVAFADTKFVMGRIRQTLRRTEQGICLFLTLHHRKINYFIGGYELRAI